MDEVLLMSLLLLSMLLLFVKEQIINSLEQ